MFYADAMKLTCPNCAATYDVADDAIGPNGRKVRCRACGASWHEPPRVPAIPARPLPVLPQPAPPPVEVATETETPPAPRRARAPWLLLGLVAAVVALGVVAALLALGPRQLASRVGLAARRVPLGIAITRQPDWRLIADGSQLFAVSGRVWNPTAETQSVPDIRAELKDKQGRTVYAWTITRPVAQLAPGQAASFDGAAVDVPPASSNVSVTFAGADGG